MTTAFRACVFVLAFLADNASAGDCKIESLDGRSVQICGDGYVETRGRGQAHMYGVRNGGVARYSGNSAPAWAIKQRHQKDQKIYV